MQRYTVYFIRKFIYMFRVVPSPIIRSANNCIYSIWYLSHRYFYLPLTAGSNNGVYRVVCAPDDGWWYHPKRAEQFADKINCLKLHLAGYILEYYIRYYDKLWTVTWVNGDLGERWPGNDARCFECLTFRSQCFGMCTVSGENKGLSVTNLCLNWYSNPVYKVKVKCTLVLALRLCTGRTAHRGSRGIALLFHDHGTRSGWGVSVTPRSLFTPGKDPVFTLQVGGSQGRSRQVRKISPPAGFDPRTVQPVASRYNVYATQPTEIIVFQILNKSTGNDSWLCLDYVGGSKSRVSDRWNNILLHNVCV